MAVSRVSYFSEKADLAERFEGYWIVMVNCLVVITKPALGLRSPRELLVGGRRAVRKQADQYSAELHPRCKAVYLHEPAPNHKS